MDAQLIPDTLGPPPPDAVTRGPPDLGRSAAAAMTIGAVVIAALYFGKELLIPLVLAAMLAFVLAPACWLLERARVPRVAAVLVVVVLAFATISGVAMVVVSQIAELTSELPRYQGVVVGKWNALTQGGGWLPKVIGLARQSLASEKGGAAGPDAALGIARAFALPLLSPLATGGIVLVFSIFILLARDDLRDRFVRLVGRHDMHRTILAMSDAGRRLSRYFLFQLALNSGFGALIGVCLWLAGLPNPLLWGVLAGIMRFVPFIGVWVAALPPLLLAVAVVPGWTLVFVVLALFFAAEMIMGQIVEPLIYGHSTGLSPIAVIVATAFWALVWGTVGLLLATPLTVCLVVIGRHVQPLAFFDVLLGDSPPLTPPESFYQRVLEGDGRALDADAKRQVARRGSIEYYDAVALPGLALAQVDLAKDVLAFERLEAIHAVVDALLTRLGTSARPLAAGALPAAWQADGAILCIPGRGQLDDLAATMAAQSLAAARFGARVAPNAMLSGRESATLDLSGTLVCCLSVFEGGSTPSAVRYFVKRIEKRMPRAEIVICLWTSGRTSPFLSALRVEGAAGHVALSISELSALMGALSTKDGVPRPL